MSNTLPEGCTVVEVRSLELDLVPELGWPAVFASLDLSEQAKAGQFSNQTDRRAYAAAHALLRHLLSQMCERPAYEWQFATSENGKPELAGTEGPRDLRFNLSHTRGMVLACAAFGVEVGADVEAVGPDRLHLHIADRFFAPAEADWLRAGGNASIVGERFAVLWTLKEAFLKAFGTGLSQPLDSFVFQSVNPIRLWFADPAMGDPKQWQFWQLAHDSFRLAVAFGASAENSVLVRHISTHVTESGEFSP